MNIKFYGLLGSIICLSIGIFGIATVTARGLPTAVTEDDKYQGFSCYMFGTPMIGDVPSIDGNCSYYFSCEPAPVGSGLITRPTEPRPCPPGHNNAPLFYDFRNCTFSEDPSVCFDPYENEAEFFACAEPYTEPTAPAPAQDPL